MDGIRKEIKGFDVQLSKFSKEFKQYGPFVWIPRNSARATPIDKYYKQLQVLVEKGKSVSELEDSSSCSCPST